MPQLNDFLISRDLVDKIVSEYANGNYSVINEKRDPAKPDSREYHYPIEIMEAFIRKIRENAEQNGLKNPGILIKMAQYPADDKIDPRQNKNYLGYQTVVLVGTNDDGSGDYKETAGVDGLDLGHLSPP